MNECGNYQTEKRLMLVFQLVLFVRKGVHIADKMVHTLVGYHVEIKASYCASDMSWL